MKTVVYSCPFVPAEWIAAHGLRPSRIVPDSFEDPGAALASQGFCPYARAFAMAAGTSGNGDAAILTTVCDQMRRASEVVAGDSRKPVFLMHVPTTWENPAAHRFYADEIKRLGRFLVEMGGNAPADADLAAVMLRYDAARSALRAARGALPARRFSEAMLEFHRRGDGTFESDLSGDPQRHSPDGGPPVALVGGPLTRRLLGIFDLIEDAGGVVALDATTTGERTLPATFDRRLVRSRPLLALADAYFGQIPDAFRRPNSGLYIWLREELAARGIRGIVYLHHTWCDTWRAEAQRMKDWCGLPFVAIEGGGATGIDGRTESRLQTFMEVLR